MKNNEEKIKNMIVDNLPDFLCAVWDDENNLIYPTNISQIERYKSIIESPTSIEGIYSIPKTGEWFERFATIGEFDGKICTLEYYKNITKFKELEMLLQQDHVTGISNRKRATLDINEYLVHALSYNEEFSVMLSDVDNFKQINDTYGHLFGDIVLKNIGDLISKNARHGIGRSNDIAGRYGGDEFFGLIKSIGFEETIAWVERANEKVKDLIHTSGDGKISITDVSMSIGMYHVSKKEIADFKAQSLSLDEIRKTIFERCDASLYEVKREHHAKKKIFVKNP